MYYLLLGGWLGGCFAMTPIISIQRRLMGICHWDYFMLFDPDFSTEDDVGGMTNG